MLAADDGYRVIDFEGEPLRPIEDRRRPESPLRDVASMLRSLDHVARSARRRAERTNGGPIERPGLDVDAWIERAPRIKLLPDTNKRQPYPLSWDEQQALFSRLPAHLGQMAFMKC